MKLAEMGSTTVTVFLATGKVIDCTTTEEIEASSAELAPAVG